MRIDTHAHVAPLRYVDALGQMRPPVAAELDALRAMMERFEIDRAVVSSGPPGAPSPEVARIVNEELAAIAHAEPHTFAAMAALPLGDTDAALTELERALDELAMDGVFVMSNVRGRYLGDSSFDPLFAELDRRGAYVFLHPTMPPHELPLPHPVWLYEFPFETTRALANLIYAGTLERFPNIGSRWRTSAGRRPSSRTGSRRSRGASRSRRPRRRRARSSTCAGSTTTPALRTTDQGWRRR
jgi:predicted TIM-barrel fold metal-dependent hydrolase